MPSEQTESSEIGAPAPRPDAEALRAAYLSLLKLTLADLAGVHTMSVLRRVDGGVVARESSEEELGYRAVGKHWPLSGLSMSGLRRLDDLQRCVEAVVADDVPGDLIETGVWRGGAAILMRAVLDSLGAEGRTVWLADSFQGFPEPAREDADEGVDRDLAGLRYLSASLQEVRANCARLGFEQGLRFVPGFFEQTLPGLRGRPWAVVRLDGDSYEATRLGLECLYPTLSTGGFLIVDDYGSIAECRRAVEEYRAEHEISEPIEEVDWTCVRWRRETAAAKVDAPADWVEAPDAPQPSRAARKLGVPTERELTLQWELEVLKQRVRIPDAPAPTERELELERQVADLTERLGKVKLELAVHRGEW